MEVIDAVGFRMSSQKAENGFVAPMNCFVALFATKQWAKKYNDFRWEVSPNGSQAFSPEGEKR